MLASNGSYIQGSGSILKISQSSSEDASGRLPPFVLCLHIYWVNWDPVDNAPPACPHAGSTFKTTLGLCCCQPFELVEARKYMNIYIYIFINNRFVVYRKRNLFNVYEGNMSTCCIFLLCSTSMTGIIIQQFHEFQSIYVCNPHPQPLQDHHLDFDCCSQSASKQIDWTEHISCEVDDGCPVAAHFGCKITLNSENILKASWCIDVGNFPFATPTWSSFQLM